MCYNPTLLAAGRQAIDTIANADAITAGRCPAVGAAGASQAEQQSSRTVPGGDRGQAAVRGAGGTGLRRPGAAEGAAELGAGAAGGGGGDAQGNVSRICLSYTHRQRTTGLNASPKLAVKHDLVMHRVLLHGPWQAQLRRWFVEKGSLSCRWTSSSCWARSRPWRTLPCPDRRSKVRTAPS